MTHDKLEALYFWSQIALAFIVLVSSAIAIIQLWMIKRQSKATLLLELDRRWDSVEIFEARIVVSQERDKIAAEVTRRFGDEVTDDSRQYFRELSAEWTACNEWSGCYVSSKRHVMPSWPGGEA